MAFTVIYDACVLYPPSLRDLLVRVAQAGIVRARWSEEILNECFENIVAQRRDADRNRLARTRALMTDAVRDCMVTGYEPLINGITLPDPGDRHVVAAAIRANAQVIVTFNTKDFPRDALAPFDLEAEHPNEFVLDLIDLDPDLVARTVLEQAADLRNPPRSALDVLARLADLGLRGAAARLEALLAS